MDQTYSQEELVWIISWLLACPTLVFSFLLLREDDLPPVTHLVKDFPPISSGCQILLHPMDDLDPSQIVIRSPSHPDQMSWLRLWWSVAWNVTFPTWKRRSRETWTPKSSPIDAISTKTSHSNAHNCAQLMHPTTGSHIIDRPESTSWKDSMGYGEIEPHTIWQIIDWVFQCSRHDDPWQLKCVVDLGSGSGMALLAAAWRWCWHQQVNGNSSCKSQSSRLNLLGMELNPYWQPIAEANANKLLFGMSQVDCTFVTADFTNDISWARTADLVLVHATVFQDELMGALSGICAQCRPGAIFAMVSRPLQNPTITTIRTFQLEMSWGLSTVYLQWRVA